MDQFHPNTRFSIFPPAIKYLLIANAIVFLATKSIFTGVWTPLGAVIAENFALWSIGNGFMPWQLLSYMFYMLTGVGAAIIHMLVSGYVTYTIGASGAVFGILLAFGMMFPNQYIILLFPPIPIKAKYFVGIYGGIELLSGLTRPDSGVAHFAHLGGLVVGFILIKYWKIKRPAL